MNQIEEKLTLSPIETVNLYFTTYLEIALLENTRKKEAELLTLEESQIKIKEANESISRAYGALANDLADIALDLDQSTESLVFLESLKKPATYTDEIQVRLSQLSDSSDFLSKLYDKIILACYKKTSPEPTNTIQKDTTELVSKTTKIE